MSRASQWNALLIQHYFSPFGTTQLKKTAKRKFGVLGGGSFCGLPSPSPSPLLVAAIIRAPANYRVVHLVIFIDTQISDSVTTSEWQPWGVWSQCTASCGQGIRERFRECTALDGQCLGDSTGAELCEISKCPGFLFINPFICAPIR